MSDKVARLIFSNQLILEVLKFPPNTKIISCGFHKGDPTCIAFVVEHPDFPVLDKEKTIPCAVPIYERKGDKVSMIDWGLEKKELG